MKSYKKKVFLIILVIFIFTTNTACSKSNKLALAKPVQVNSESNYMDSSSALLNSSSNSSSSAVSSKTPSKVEESSSSAPKIIPVTGISLSKTKVSLTVGEKTMPIVNMTPKTATNKDEIWISSNTKVATVDRYGNIKAIGVGSCTVTVTAASNKSVLKKVSVAVKAKVVQTVAPKVSLTPASPVVAPSISSAMDSRAQGYSSATSYLILVDLGAQKVGIYTGQKGRWNLVQNFICSSGTAGENATPTGTFTIHSHGAWFFSKSAQEGGEWWTQFSGNFLFHSLPMDQNRNIVDATLGKPASHGCIRLAVENAKWIYNNIPRGTTVNIY